MSKPTPPKDETLIPEEAPVDESHLEGEDENLETGEDVDPDPAGEVPPAEDGDDELDEPAEEREPLDLKQPKVNLRHDIPLDKKEVGELKLVDCVAFLRESHRNAAAIMEHNDEFIGKLEAAEDKLVAELNKLGRAMEEGDGSAWFRTLLESLSIAQIDNMGLGAAERSDSLWGQSLTHNGKEIRPGQPRQALSAGAHTNDELLSYMTKKAGIGTTFDFPMWQSGIWLRFRSPSNTEIVAMQHELTQKRVELGATTKGMGFSNTSQTLLNVAVNFALQFVIDASVAYKTPSDLEAKLDALDAPSVLLGLASTMFPGGLPYASPCMADVGKCDFVMKAKLNMHALQRVDTLGVSKFQAGILSRRFGNRGMKTNEDELKQYQEEHRSGRERVVWFNDIGLRLGTPSLMDQREAGEAWINSIVEMTQGAFNEPPHGTNRNRYINQLGQTTTARQYAHWVKAVLERVDESLEEASDSGYRVISEDPVVVNQFLNTVMSTDDYQDAFFDEVKKFIEDSMISMVAIPSWNCPKCGSPTAKQFHERFEHLVPLDMLSLFFILASRKLSYKSPTKMLGSQD